ncbi:MAG: FHA domain-containing protein [Pirellulales bacterium]
MEFSLKVMSGKNAGLLIKVPHERFLIGRSEECQLRPHSDLISRQHTELLTKGDGVTVKDMGSRNGTFVNGERISDSVALKHGDKLGVGQLIFEVLLPQTIKKTAPVEPVAHETVANSAPKVGTAASNNVIMAPPKQPKVKDVADVAKRVSAKAGADDDDISDWLNGDDVDSMNETSTIQLSQTQQWELQTAAEGELSGTSDSAVTTPGSKTDPKGKKVYGKLPTVPKQGIDAKNSRDAAADLIKQMMKKR